MSSTWTHPDFGTADYPPFAGGDVGSANTQDEFYGYGEGLMNPDQIVLDMKERIHMIQADATPFFSWTSALRKTPCHNTNFTWMEDEIFGHRDFKAILRRRESVAASAVYIYTLQIVQQGDWQALEAAAQADTYSDERPTINVQITPVTTAEGEAFAIAPLVMGLADGRKSRQYTTDDGETLDLANEIILLDDTDAGSIGGNGTRPEIASAGDAFDPTDWDFSTSETLEIYCHTATPNDVLKGYPQGSGIPNSSRKRSRSFHNYVQIFKTSLSIANTLKHIRLYGGPQLARDRMRKVVQHKVDIENALIFQGGGTEGTDWGNIPTWGAENPLTRFKGLGVGAVGMAGGDASKAGWIYSKNADIDAGFTLAPATAGLGEINALAHRVFDDVTDNPSSTKVVFAGHKWFLALSEMAMNDAGGAGYPVFGWRNQSGNSLGINIKELETPSGNLRFVRMPHFRGRYEDYALVMDMSNIEVRPLQGRDTKMIADAGDKTVDGQVDFFITELGMECRHESTHAILRLA